MAITDQTLTLLARRRQELGITLADQELALVKAWVEAWDQLHPEFEDALRELTAAARGGRLRGSQVTNSIRMRAVLDLAATRLDELANFAEVTAANDLKRTVLQAAREEIEIAASQLPQDRNLYTAPGWTMVNDSTLDAIVLRTTEVIHKELWPLSADAVKAMKANLVKGIAVGDHPDRVAARMVRQAEKGFNGGLTRALVITRTEMLDAHRAGGKASDLANRSVVATWQWMANLDAATCPSCLAQHGQEFPIEEDGPLDHQCGRCVRLPKTKSWKDLGFDIEEPEDLLPNSEEWFNSLTPDTQRRIMGPTRLELLQNGDISWGDLAQRKSTDGWRDSYHVTPVRDLLPKEAT